jgi:hypothetical protein
MAMAYADNTTQIASRAPATDPVFAAIEAHRAALLAFKEAVEHRSKIEDTLVGLDCPDTPELIAARAREVMTCYGEDNAAWGVASIRPTTLAGVSALLRYASEVIISGDNWPSHGMDLPNRVSADVDWSTFLHMTLADAMDDMLSRPPLAA